MKLTISILFCVIITLQYNGADGALKDLFGRIHDSVHGATTKVKQDFNTLIHPNASKPQESTESSNIHFVDDESEEDVAAAAAAKKPDEVTPAPPTSTSTVAPSASTTTLSPSASATTLSPLASATTLAPTTTTKKEGKENFSGACLAGYMRTPDGRCKPTF